MNCGSGLNTKAYLQRDKKCSSCISNEVLREKEAVMSFQLGNLATKNSA